MVDLYLQFVTWCGLCGVRVLGGLGFGFDWDLKVKVAELDQRGAGIFWCSKSICCKGCYWCVSDLGVRTARESGDQVRG